MSPPQAQLLWQAVRPSAKRVLRPPKYLRLVGRNHLHPNSRLARPAKGPGLSRVCVEDVCLLVTCQK